MTKSSRNPIFYFGSVVFFLGVLLLALGVSKLTAQSFDILPFAEVISGAVLVIVGMRAIRS